MITRDSLISIYDKIINIGISVIVSNPNISVDISNYAIELINKANVTELSIDEVECIDIILHMSNYIYNNSTLDSLILDDGVYDQLLQVYKKYNPNYQIGSIPAILPEQPTNEFEDDDSQLICTFVDPYDESKMYAKDIWKCQAPIDIPCTMICEDLKREPITKRLINTVHKFPELVGTLDKCKFVLNSEAREKGVFDKPSVAVFERDFLHKAVESGIIDPNVPFEMVGELKYDGVSLEAEICGDTIIYAVSRGDTGENIASDLTPIFGGYKFPHAKDVPNDFTFGMKFEVVITKYNLQILSQRRGTTYKNCRNAIIGILGASDAYNYVDLMTLIPLSTSLGIDRIKELEWMNKHYTINEYNRYIPFRGNYNTMLYHVKQFTGSAEYIRPLLPYLIDGVVISFTDPHIKAVMGRVNSVNKWSIAIKFNPKTVRTIFLGYSYNIGKSGDIIPMAHFKPCEFIGTIHTKQTIHSYKRFKELNLIRGQQIDVSYVNDVISYVKKPDTQLNRDIEYAAMTNPNNPQPERFINVCPYCGASIQISESGNSAKCPNVNCPERMIMRTVDMVDKLGFTDISEERIRSLGCKSFVDVVSLEPDNLTNILGKETANKYMNHVNRILSEPIEDYKIMAALGFDNMGEEKWKLVLSVIDIQSLLTYSDDMLYDLVDRIKGLNRKTGKSIIDGRKYYEDDLMFITEFINLISYKNAPILPKVAISGFRDSEFIELLKKNGFDASDKYSVNKQTYALVVLNKNQITGKSKNAMKYNIPIYTREEFINFHHILI